MSENIGQADKQETCVFHPQRRKKWIKAGIITALILITAGIIAYAAFYHADTLEIEDGKLKGVPSVWLIGKLTDDNRYVKLADVGFIAEYKTKIRDLEDPDNDPLTNYFAYQARKPEANPGWMWVSSSQGTPEEAARKAGFDTMESAVISEKEGYLVRREENGELILGFFMESPYSEISIETIVTVPWDTDEGKAKELLSGMVEQVHPGKKISKLASDFKQNFIDDNRWKFLTNGLDLTIQITLGAVLLGIVIGVLVAVTRSTWDQNGDSMRPGIGKAAMGVANGICKVYLTVIRGTPVVIQLMIIYYVIFSGSRNGLMIGILAFGINSGAYVAEIIRGGIMSVDRGQLEAGRSLGFGYVQTMQYIVVPQALKSVLPALANEFIVLLKETSVAGYVAVMDLTKGGETIRSLTNAPFLPLLAVAAIYLIIVMFFTWLVGKLERRLRASDH